MRESADHPSQDRGRRRVRRSQCRSWRGSKSGGAADAGDSAGAGSGGRTDVVLQPIPVAPKGAALDRLRGRAAAASDRKALQAAVARPLLGRQDLSDFVKVRNARGASDSPAAGKPEFWSGPTAQVPGFA